MKINEHDFYSERANWSFEDIDYTSEVITNWIYEDKIKKRVKENTKILDLGTAAGEKVLKKFPNCAEILGTDFSDKMIETAKKSPYYEIINSFYGIGEILTAEILGELGDITRFDSPKQLIAFCGLDPTIKQSGKSINVKGAISKRGNKYARYILFNCSQMVVKLGASNYPEHPVYIYYQNKKAEGKHYYESLTACSTKILRMLYSMCKNNKQFLEN